MKVARKTRINRWLMKLDRSRSWLKRWGLLRPAARPPLENFSASLSHQSGLSVLTLRSKIEHGRAMPACARRAARSNSCLRPLLTPPYWGARQYRGKSVSNERRCCHGTPCTCQVRILACTPRAYTHGPQLRRAGSASDSGQNSLCPSSRPRAPARCHSGGSSQVARCLPPPAVSAAARPPGSP
jgi:hypothetical protein